MLNLDRPENDAVTEEAEEGEDPADMKIEAPDLPYDVVVEPLYDEPKSSMWGEIDSCTRLANGIFSVSTPSHGGTMVRMELRKHFSDIVWSIGVDDGIYHCYEEDCAEAVVLREMIDKGIMVVPPWQLHDVEAFEASINQTCEQWNPEYWSWRTKQIENDPNYPQHHLIQMPIPEEDMEMGDD